MDIIEFDNESDYVYVSQSAYARIKGVSRQAIFQQIKTGKVKLGDRKRLLVTKKEVLASGLKFSWKPFLHYNGSVENNDLVSPYYSLLKKLDDLPEAVIDTTEIANNKRNSLPKSKGRKIA